MKKILISLIAYGICNQSIAQNYHAVNGSSLAGSITVHNNPASILSAPYRWDVTLFGTQVKSATNAFTIHNYSLLSSPANSRYSIDAGDYARKADLNFNTNLLNARFAINRNKAIALGMNARGYARVRTSGFNFIDTLEDINNFFIINPTVSSYKADVVSSSWIEIYASYSQTIWDDTRGRLNAGVTLKAMRGISGGYAKLQNVQISTVSEPGGGLGYQIASGDLAYGYSANYDKYIDESLGKQSFMNFLTNTEGGLSMDIGVEYLVKTQAVNTFYDEDDGYYEYEWKIGLSLLDIGRNQFKHGRESARAINPRNTVTADTLQQKFETVQDFAGFNDSLATIVNNYSSLAFSPKFIINNPTRLVLNVDRYLFNDFYLNGEVSFNLSSLAGKKNWYVRELNFLTVTPRWETRRWGAYLPIQYNSAGKFWIGGAFKAGPVLLGIHNLSNLFLKNNMQNGGGYLAIIIRAGKKTENARYKKVDCR